MIRVDVEHFACIRRATVEFGPGLNVLFGPNDLGKSTLGRAIRAALLLPHTSSAAQEFIEWDSDKNPDVKLTLELPDRRIWRIEKCFGGSGGASVLRESTDGLTFSLYKKSREVDDEVRSMLGWGIASPATKGAPKGLPTSFLAQVLLGEQTDVAGILRQTIERDTDESGRERLTNALAAFAQDPMFKSILEAAQDNVDLAFTPKGTKKRARNSPFREVTDHVTRVKQELERLAKRVDDSENARRELEACNMELLRSQEAKLEAVEKRDVLRQAKLQLEARRNVEAELSRAAQVLAEELAEVETLREKEALLEQTRNEVDEAQKGQQVLARAQETYRAKEKVAEEAVRRAESDEAEHARHVRRVELEKRTLELDADQKSLDVKRAAATRARSLHGELEKHTSRATELAETRKKSEDASAAAEIDQQDAERKLELMDVATRLKQRRRCESSIEELDQIRREVEAERSAANEHRARAQELLEGIPPDLPDITSVGSMKQLAHDLEVAEAKLGGGLAVLVERLQPVALRATADGSALDVPADGRINFAAIRGFALQIGESAKISVAAGEKGARDSEATLRRKWEEKVVPVLARLGAADLPSLAQRVDEAERVRSKAQEAEATAAGLEQRATTREEQLSKLPGLRQELSAINQELQGKPIDRAAEMLDELGDTPFDGHRAKLKRDLAAAREDSESAKAALADCHIEARVLSERIQTVKAAIAELGVAEPDNGWDAFEAEVADSARQLHDQKEAISGELEALAAEHDAAVQTAEAELVETQKMLATAKAKLDESTETLQALRENASRLEGEIENRRAAAARLDIEASTGRVDEITARLNALPMPCQEVTDEVLRQAEVAVDEAERAYEVARDACRKAEGALQTVGGQVVLEEHAAATDALRLAERMEHEVELEYAAWQLLVNKLREAENTEGHHLGEALSRPITERFAELTANRYGKFDVGPNLQAEGLQVAGLLRDVAALSVGTQEQLATLLRLTIAEHLQSTVVMDDHLTQTDPTRSAWFRDVLRAHASKAQVIVLTCRPEDYLRKEDLPEQGETMATSAGGLVRAVDLTQLLERLGMAQSGQDDGVQSGGH